MTSEAEFDAAVTRAKSLPRRPSDEQLLELYGLYKQATAGDVHGEEPGFFDFVGRAKYDAWARRKGMSAEEARRAYVALVDQLAAGG
ncbi:MAG: acyl-CoA-binding protein [Acidobacteriota bacterium]|jgi:acyl-CoA-binding protein